MSVSLTSHCLTQAVSKVLEDAEREITRLLMELSLTDRLLLLSLSVLFLVFISLSLSYLSLVLFISLSLF